tara:strand:- start:9006 stop:10478 length:1473 start_codon:yes stop_codon:yes gene_type:complete
LAPYFIFYNQNFEEITFSQTMQPFLLLNGLLFLNIASLFLIIKIVPRFDNILLITSIVLTAVILNFDFFYRDLLWKNLESLIALTSPRTILFSFIIILISFISILLKIQFLRSFFLFFCVFFLLVPALQIVLKSYNNFQSDFLVEKSNQFKINDMQYENKLNENVYFILLDGYASNKTFSRMSFDNSNFYSFLTDNGFEILGSKAAYNRTYLALTGLFNLNYPVIEGDQPYKHQKNFFPLLLGKESAAPLIEKLDGLNYELILFGNGWSGCNPKHITCPELSNKDIFPSWISFESWVLLSKTLFRYFIKYNFDFDAMGNFIEHNKNKIISKDSKFYFIHHMSPHPPYLFNDCKTLKAESLVAWETPEDYLATVKCVNEKFIELFSLINREDPSGIIVIQSDHGPMTAKNWVLNDKKNIHIDNRLSIINAIKSPELCDHWIKDNMGPINTVRFVLACISQKQPSYIDEKSFIAARKPDENYGTVREYFSTQ